jgi:acylphosphatase
MAEGSKQSLERFLQFLHTGSPSSSVTEVETDWAAATAEFSDFEVHYF